MAQLYEEALRLPCETAQGCSKVIDSEAPEPVESSIAQGCQILWCVTAVDGAAIFVERLVSDVVHAIFDRAPMSPLHPGPIQIIVEADGAFQRAAFDSSMPLIERARRLPLRLLFALLVGGKRPRRSWSILAGFLAVMWAGCPSPVGNSRPRIEHGLTDFALAEHGIADQDTAPHHQRAEQVQMPQVPARRGRIHQIFIRFRRPDHSHWGTCVAT